LAIGDDPRVGTGAELLYMRTGKVKVSFPSNGSGKPILGNNLPRSPERGIAGREDGITFKVEEN